MNEASAKESSGIDQVLGRAESVTYKRSLDQVAQPKTEVSASSRCNRNSKHRARSPRGRSPKSHVSNTKSDKDDQKTHQRPKVSEKSHKSDFKDG